MMVEEILHEGCKGRMANGHFYIINSGCWLLVYGCRLN